MQPWPIRCPSLGNIIISTTIKIGAIEAGRYADVSDEVEWCGDPNKAFEILRRVTRPIGGFLSASIAGRALPFCPRMTKRTRLSINTMTYYHTTYFSII